MLGDAVGVAFGYGQAINPEHIPGADIDVETLRTHAKSISTVATAIRDNTLAINNAWAPITQSYVAPESQQLLDLMTPVSTRGDEVASDLDTISSALTTFADEVEPIKTALDALRAKATEFVEGPVRNGVVDRSRGSDTGAKSRQYRGQHPWGETASWQTPDDERVDWDRNDRALDYNNSLVGQANATVPQLWAAERSCANKIRGLWGGVPLVSGDACTPSNMTHKYGYDHISEDWDMPWGGKAEYREEGLEKVINGIGRGLYNFGAGIVQFGAGLLGFYDMKTGEWGWDANNILTTIEVTVTGLAAVGLAIVAAPFKLLNIEVPGAVGDALDWGWDLASKMFPTAEEWAKDPWAAGTELFLNLASIAVPVAAGFTVGVKVTSQVGTALLKGLQNAAKFFNGLDPMTALTAMGGKLVGFASEAMSRPLLALTQAIDRLFPNESLESGLGRVVDSINAEVTRLIDSGVDRNSISIEIGSDGSVSVLSSSGVTKLVEGVPAGTHHVPSVGDDLAGGAAAEVAPVAHGRASEIVPEGELVTAGGGAHGAADVASGSPSHGGGSHSGGSSDFGSGSHKPGVGGSDDGAPGGGARGDDGVQPHAGRGDDGTVPGVDDAARVGDEFGSESGVSSSESRGDLADSADGPGGPSGPKGPDASDAPDPNARPFKIEGSDDVYYTRWSPEQVATMLSAHDEIVRILEDSAYSMDDLHRILDTKLADLTPDEAAFLIDLREKFTVDIDTVFQKVLSPEDALGRLDSSTYKYDVDSLPGFVARLQDVLSLKTPRELVDGLALDYKGNPFEGGATDMYVVRGRVVTDKDLPSTPLGSELHAQASPGTAGPMPINQEPPYTGNGFTKPGASGEVIPEFRFEGASRLAEGAEMWRISPDGEYVLHAVLIDDGVSLSWKTVV